MSDFKKRPKLNQVNFDDIFYYDDLEVPKKYQDIIDTQKEIAIFAEDTFVNSRYVQDRLIYNFWGIPIFSWDRWEDGEIGELKYYNCIFLFESLQKYNGSTVILDTSGKLLIMPIFKGLTKWEGYCIEIPEFRELMFNILNKGKYPIYIDIEEERTKKIQEELKEGKKLDVLEKEEERKKLQTELEKAKKRLKITKEVEENDTSPTWLRTY